MAYLGNTPTTQSFISGTDYFNGTGSQTAFTLSRAVVSVNDIEAVVNNVVQQPNTAYTISGTTITFTSAPSSGTSNIYVRYLSTTTQSITPSQNTVSYSTLNSDTQSKLGISFKNRIINGACVVDQRNAGASISIPDSNVYPIDRFIFRNATDGTATGQQSSTVPTGGGFVNSVVWTVGTADASLGTSQYARIAQVIEGYNIADLQWGTASAKTVTISFWVRSSVTGTFSVVLYNAGTTRGFASNYTISAANTWEQKTITVTGCPDGTWGSTNTGGMTVNFGLGAGTDYQIAAGSWVTTSSVPLASTSQTNLMATAGATFYITGVQLEVGTQATTFDYRSYGTELALCQRYFNAQNSPAFMGALCFSTNRVLSGVGYGGSYMRATPTVTVPSNGITFYLAGAAWNSSAIASTPTQMGWINFDVTVTASAGAAGVISVANYTLSAEL